MKRILERAVPLFLSAVFIISGCSSKDNTVSENVDFTGNYPVENYVPDKNDINAVPYTYSGEGINFDIKCSVRELGENEKVLKTELKKETREQLLQTGKQNYRYSEEYDKLLEKTDFEIEMLEQADRLYVTEITGEYKGRGKITNEDVVSYSIDCDDRTILSSACTVNSEQWISIINTADGSYTEGILIPNRDSLKMTVTFGETTEELTLLKQ